MNLGAHSCHKGMDNPVQHAPGASRAVPLVCSGGGEDAAANRQRRLSSLPASLPGMWARQATKAASLLLAGLQDLVVTPWFGGLGLTPRSRCRAPTGGCSTESPAWSRGCSQRIAQAAAFGTQRKKQRNIEEQIAYVFKSRRLNTSE